jgi:subtilisin family serine protease
VSRRSQAGRHSWSLRRQALKSLASRGLRKRRTFSFERLEDRHYFSVSPLLNYQTVSLSNDTPEGAAAIWERELAWAGLQAGTATSRSLSDYATRALPNDPLFSSQWHLFNVGQAVGTPDFQPLYGVPGEDINVVPAWNRGYTGAGVSVAVIDSGVQTTHPDLVGNLHPTLSLNAISGGSNANPDLIDPGSGHGTSVAGLIGATWNNLGGPLLGQNGQPVLDINGNPVYLGGGTGVAPEADLVPIKLIANGYSLEAELRAFQYVTQNGIDITNNSWGPAVERSTAGITPQVLQAIRDSVVFGRDGLGVINVFASGNSGGPSFSPGFQSFGNYDNADYDGYVSSRYTIGVSGVDHDGMYGNADGTFTSYPEAGASVLVAAPTGSNVAQNVGDDTGQGSGIWTADLVGDFGYNAAPLPSGFDFDRDFLADPDYTARFNGTSAAAPIAAGVIALILDANPNLTYRDVQEILVRSARQNAQFEIPESGGLRSSRNTWQTNQLAPFRVPDPWHDEELFPRAIEENPFAATRNPLADPLLGPNFFEALPPLYTNGAGYTVSQGYGVYSEQVGYAHGVIDAGLAVKLAEQWHLLQQNINPLTERTFSTFVLQPGLNIPPAEKMSDEFGALLVPGGLGGLSGFIGYWNEFYVPVEYDDEGVADPESGPFTGDDPPQNTRGLPYLEFQVPDDQAMNVEWVEVKVDISGPAEDLDFLRLLLVSPEGTHSELNHFYADPAHTPFGLQAVANIEGAIDPAGDLDTDGGSFVWTFSTNRSWGERSSNAVIIDPLTGEPIASPFGVLDRGWRLHVENWSDSEFLLDGLEVVWHGKPLAQGTQRVQGFVGIDTNGDVDFNYDRTDQFAFDSDADPMTVRAADVRRIQDLDQEPFAENVLVEAFRVVNGVAQPNATARFLTGADGNYYLDLDPSYGYEIRITDPEARTVLNDTATPSQFLQHYKSVWRITPDWFFAPDRKQPANPLTGPGEVLYNSGANAPMRFLVNNAPVPMAVKNINFLLEQEVPPNEIVVKGTVYADLNGNGAQNGDDTAMGNVLLFADANRNGSLDAGEQQVVSSVDPLARGQYQFVIPATALGTFAIGIIRPTPSWTLTNPSDGLLDILAAPGDTLTNVNFFLDPPDAFPPSSSGLGSILGVVYDDHHLDGNRGAGDVGLSGFRVFIDSAIQNGLFDAGERESITSGNGSFYFNDVAPNVAHLLRVEDGPTWDVLTPASGVQSVTVGVGGAVTGVLFGLKNLAGRDWGDLPDSYNTLSGSDGPNHVVVVDGASNPIFYLGSGISGDVDGQPTPGADGDALDDGIVILSNNGKLQIGANTLQVTVTGIGGLLNGWIDWNDSGVFDSSEHLIWQYSTGGTAQQADLNPGSHTLTFFTPENLVGGQLAARLRWGEPNLGPTGAAMFGEVEDYILPSSVPLTGDFDGSGLVDEADRGIWRATFGSTTDLRADANKNGVVDAADFVLWRNNLGATAGGGSSLATGSGAGGGNASTSQIAVSVAARSGSLAGLSTVVASSLSSSVVISPAVPDASSSTGDDRVTGVVIDWLVSPAATAANPPTLGDSVISAVATSDNLLLVDQAWAEIDADDADDDSLVGRVHDDEEECLSEMALAAVFEEEDNWWHAI